MNEGKNGEQGNEWIANRIKKVDPRWGYPSEKGERSSSD